MQVQPVAGLHQMQVMNVCLSAQSYGQSSKVLFIKSVHLISIPVNEVQPSQVTEGRLLGVPRRGATP